MSDRSCKKPVRVKCYGEIKTYKNRDEALKFFNECMMFSEGAERERYVNIVCGLMYSDSELVCDYENE